MTTGPDGQATGNGYRPNKEIGQFEISLEARHNGDSGQAKLMQTNAVGQGTVNKKKLSVGVVAVIVVAAALLVSVGAYAATRP